MYKLLRNTFKKIYFQQSLEPFIPKSLMLLNKGYTSSLFFDDLKAGLTIGCISLPLAMALAISSGVSPERGLYTAIVAGFLISLLGGCRVQIGGPTGAYVILVYNTVQKHGYEGLALATLIAGVLLLLAGILRLGSLIRFIPYPVTTGFTAGIATVLFVSQIKDFLGLSIQHPSTHFTEKISELWQFFETVNPTALFVSLITLVTIIVSKRFSKKVPAAIVAIIAATLITYLLNLPVRTIENSFGCIPNTLLTPAFPYITLSAIQAVLPDAVAIALLGGIESLLSCVIADSLTGYRHKSNCELVGQGIANIASSLCGGIPATGAIARTGANIQLGAKTPVSGMIHALTVLLLMLVLGPVAIKMPLAALSTVLMVVAWNMSEREQIKNILKGPISDRSVLITTYFLTVFIDLSFAVQIGVLLAGISFLKKMTDKAVISSRITSDAVLHLSLTGPFFFGISEILSDALANQKSNPKAAILSLDQVPFIDATAIQAIQQFHKKCVSKGIVFYITEAQPEVLKVLSQMHLPIVTSSDEVHDVIQGYRQESDPIALQTPLAVPVENA